VNYRESFGFARDQRHPVQSRIPLAPALSLSPAKVTDGAARIKLGLTRELGLGNIDAKRDWGHAKDYVEAMWLIFSRTSRTITLLQPGRTTTVARHVPDRVRALSG